MTFYTVILWIAAIGVVIGGGDYMMGNRLGFGAKFCEGFKMMSQLALSATGIIVLAPMLAQWLAPVLTPFFHWLHADPAMFAATIANDMGGYPLAIQLAETPEMGLMAGCITASMLGCTLTFSLPVGLGMLFLPTDKQAFIRGMLIGLITIPIGSIVGGVVAGFDARMVLRNNLPIAMLAAILALGLLLLPGFVCRLMDLVGKAVEWISVIGIMVGAFMYLTGMVLPGFEKAETIVNALSVAAKIAVVLIGILPILELLTRLCEKPLEAFGKRLGINSTSATGLICTLASPVPTFGLFREMDARGKVINIAWLVSAASVFGAHLGFTAGVQPDMVLPMVVGKLVAGGCALILACVIEKNPSETSPSETPN